MIKRTSYAAAQMTIDADSDDCTALAIRNVADVMGDWSDRCSPTDMEILADAIIQAGRELKAALRKGQFDAAFGIASRLDDYSGRCSTLAKKSAHR